MKITTSKLDKKNRKLTFTLSGCSEGFANAVRRTIIDDVPTLAVEEVEFKDNSSALYDEIVAHRLGLIPIKTDLKSYELPKSQADIDERSAKCTLKITLKANKKGVVLSGDAQSADPKCTFAYDDMPITKLISKQKIECTCIAVMGVGRDHAKWSPGTVFYRHEPKITFDDKKLSVEQKEKLLLSAPKGSIVEKSGKLTLHTDIFLSSSKIDGALSMMEQAGMQITDGENLLFTVEGWGQLSTKDMLDKSFDILLEKLDEFEKSL